MHKVLFWLPRVLSILFIAFISIFALDVFEEPHWFLALIIHLIPSLILAILTAFAWKHESVGASLFVTVGILMLLFYQGEMLILAIPCIIIGALYALHYYTVKPAR